MAWARTFLTLALGVVLLLWASTFFRLDALFRFLEPQALSIFMPFVAFAIGLAAEYFRDKNLSHEQRRRVLRLRCISLIPVFLILFSLHSTFVLYAEHWGKSYVVGSERVASRCDCPPEDSDEDCLKKLMAYGERAQQKIYDCWGEGSVRTVELSLAALYLIFAGFFGSIAGLRILPKPPFRVFVSYRRKDSDLFVNEILAESLRDELGKGNVFVDKHSIEGGEKWARKIKSWCNICQAVVVVIGPNWLRELEAERTSKDWVKYEIERAIQRKVKLLPILIGGAKMPTESELPTKMATLAKVQAIEVDESEGNLDELMVAFEELRILSS